MNINKKSRKWHRVYNSSLLEIDTCNMIHANQNLIMKSQEKECERFHVFIYVSFWFFLVCLRLFIIEKKAFYYKD